VHSIWKLVKVLVEERKRMITLQCRLEFKTPEEEKEVLKLMQNFSSCRTFHPVQGTHTTDS